MDFYALALLQGLAFVPLALGIFLSAKVFNIPDITTDGSYTLGAAVFAVCMLSNMHPLMATLLVMPAGAAAGAVTGIIHTKLKMNALLAGILVMTALYSVNLLIMERSNIPLLGTPSLFVEISNPDNLLINIAIAGILVTIITSILLWLLKTDFGLAMRAAGSNENMIEANGVNTNRIKIIGLSISNALVALSGCLVTQMQGFADINMGIGIVIAGLASVMMGESISRRLQRNTLLIPLLMVVMAAVIFRLCIAFILAQGIEQVYVKLFSALLVLLFIGVTKINFIKK
jgi:putative ABC transport system permease protein